MNARIRIFLFCIAILLTSCEFPASFEPFAPLPPPDLGPGASALPIPINLYVSPSGDDANSCTSASDACQTLQAAADKADNGDTINMAAGTYPTLDTTIANWAEIHKRVSIVGAGMDATFLDIRTYYGLLIVGADDVVIRDLTIRNRSTTWASTGIGFDDAAGSASIENVRVQDFPSRAIRHDGSAQLSLTNVIIEGSSFGGASGVQAQNCAIHDSEIRGNNNAGLLCSILVMENSVVQGNGWYGLLPYPDVPTSSISILDSYFENNGFLAIFINGGLATLTRVTLSANGLSELGAATERSAIGTFGEANLEIINSTIMGNYRGIHLRGNSLVVRSSQLSENLNAAVYDDSLSETSIRLIDTDVVENNAGPSPDGAAIISTDSLEIRGSRISGNSGGAVFFTGAGTTTIIETSMEGTVNPSRYAALYLTGRSHIERSLIANNEGTGIWSLGPLTLVNSTISGNSGTGAIGGLAVRAGDVTLRFTTIAENEGIGFYWFSSSDVVLVESSLIAANTGRDCDADRALGHATWAGMTGVNIDTDGTCGFEETYDPPVLLLGPLADNTGPTWTHALQVGSPAIDAIPEGCISEDQRNLFRPYNDACDVGAYEYHFALSTLVVVPLSDTNCRLGNSTAFDIADTLFADVEYSPIARGTDNLWLLFEGPATGTKCWAYAAGFALTVDGDPVDLGAVPNDLLPVAAYPPPPVSEETDGDEGGDDEADGGDGGSGSAPSAPSKLAANEIACNTADGYRVKLTWNDNSNNELGFRIYDNGALIATLDANQTQYTHQVGGNVSQQQNYYMEAYNDSGAAPSNTATEDGCLY